MNSADKKKIRNSRSKKNYCGSSMRNRRGLTLALLNCRSIRSEAKARDFVMFVREHNPDIILGTESWLSDDVSDAEIFPSDYVTYRRIALIGREAGYL